MDIVTGNNGTLTGNVSYGPGLVGQAFVFNGNGAAVTLGSPASLQLQSFTIEAWIQRSSLTLVTTNGGDAVLFGYGQGGYGLGIWGDGTLGLEEMGVDNIRTSAAVTDTNWHHVAVTKSGSTVVFYTDGSANPVSAYNSTFSFNTSVAIGARADNLAASFLGSIDELAVYNRALTATEILAIYNANSFGKCLSSSPMIIIQPTNCVILPNGTATFAVTANGTPPLNFQWEFNGIAISGATNASMILNDVQNSQAGNYAVVVSNALGSATSSNAVLTVLPPPPCDPAPSGLVSWWKADSNALDAFGGNNGTLVGSAGYGLGVVGQAFVFSNSGDAVALSNPTNLQLQDLTIETWIKRSSISIVTLRGADGVLFGGGDDLIGSAGYALALWYDGTLAFETGNGTLHSIATITDANWHHVAVTKSFISVTFYIDGSPAGTADCSSTFTFGTGMAIGNRPGNLCSFYGSIDELAVYNRALTSGEIQAIYNANLSGKCPSPVIITQPVNRTNMVGQSATFTVMAGGAPPVAYQWTFNGTALTSATNATLAITNLQLTDAGNYAVTVSNFVGAIVSSNAVLTVIPLPLCDPVPSGIVNWWKADGNALDSVGGGNSGTLSGNVGYGPGMVGQAFVFNGAQDIITATNPAGLLLQDFTVETWIKRTSNSVVTLDQTYNDAKFFSCGSSNGFQFGIIGTGSLSLGQFPAGSFLQTAVAITDTNWHHVAVTAAGHTVVFYIDGLACNTSTGWQPELTFEDSMAIGAMPLGPHMSFYGSIDELAIYNRALTAGEIQAIYNANLTGKCPSPDVITQPASATNFLGITTTITAVAVGATPLSYQWNFNGTPLAGATNATLVLPNAQLANAGVYSVTVANAFGTVTSSNAVLTLVPIPPCYPAPSGLVSWWQAEGNARDSFGGNDGSLIGNVSYGPGLSGKAFVFSHAGDMVDLGNPASLQLQNLTIEMWIKRSSSSVISLSQEYYDSILLFGGGNAYPLWIQPDGTLAFGIYSADRVATTVAITDTSWHHIAVTKDGNTVSFYIDGNANVVSSAFNETFTFGQDVVIGNNGGLPVVAFFGSIDEVAIYNRALTSGEIQSIYHANLSEKCPSPPIFMVQPTNCAVPLNETATFTVAASGTQPLSYQWSFDGATIQDGTNASLTLNNVQPSQAGDYSVIVSNTSGSVMSSDAVLTVLPPPPCDPVPANAVSWWPAEGNALDVFGGNNGALAGNVGYGPGMVGQAFVFNGNGEAITLGNPTNLQLQNFTIEAWIKRSSLSLVTSGGGDAVLFGCGQGGYGLGIWGDGTLGLEEMGVNNVRTSAAITDTNWHHAAVTLSGGTATFYLDGSVCGTAAYNSTFTFGTGVAIGARADNLAASFLGSIDEMAVYSRALATNEIQAIYNANFSGKCSPLPSVLVQPANQSVVLGCSVTFNVQAGGTSPFSYQWWKDGQALQNQTNPALTINNIQSTDLGNYSVIITNLYGSITSSNAMLSQDHLPVTAADTVLRFPFGGVRIRIADVLTNDTDPDGDPLAIISVSSNTPAGATVTLSYDYIYYTAPAGFSNSDSFTYTVSDGHPCGTAQGTVAVQIKTDTSSSPPWGMIGLQNDGSSLLTYEGIPYWKYRIQYANTLPPTNWFDLITLTSDVYGIYQYVDLPLSNASSRFYRSVSP